MDTGHSVVVGWRLVMPGMVLLESEAVGVERPRAGAGRGGRQAAVGALQAGALAALEAGHWAGDRVMVSSFITAGNNCHRISTARFGSWEDISIRFNAAPANDIGKF